MTGVLFDLRHTLVLHPTTIRHLPLVTRPRVTKALDIANVPLTFRWDHGPHNHYFMNRITCNPFLANKRSLSW
jgi:hypothetical protein